MERYGISFKEMSKKQKAAHIWVYYRYHILAGIIACFMILMLGKTLIFPKPANEVDVMICGPLYLNANEIDVAKEFEEDYNTGLNLISLNWTMDAETANVMYQKIPLMVTTDSLEIVALPEEQYEYFVKIYGADMFTPLEEVPELTAALEKEKDNLFTYDKAVDEEGNEIDADSHVYGIKLSAFPTVDCIDQNGEMIIGLTSKLRHRNKALCMYKYLLGDETALAHYNDPEVQQEAHNQ